MKTLSIVFTLSILIFSACDDILINKVSNGAQTHTYTFEITGDCNFISIYDSIDVDAPGFIYHELPEKYTETGVVYTKDNYTTTIEFKIIKHTDDTSIVTGILYIDSVEVQQETTQDAYGQIVLTYTF
jgi:hypothetical protein